MVFSLVKIVDVQPDTMPEKGKITEAGVLQDKSVTDEEAKKQKNLLDAVSSQSVAGQSETSSQSVGAQQSSGGQAETSSQSVGAQQSSGGQAENIS